MNTFELCVSYRRVIMNRAAEVMAYENWDDEFAAKQIREAQYKIKDMGGFEYIDPSDLTKEEMENLGFGKWNEESEMMLIPLWLFPFLKQEFNAGCIDGSNGVLNKSEMDNDNRFGLLAYGVMPKDFQ